MELNSASSSVPQTPLPGPAGHLSLIGMPGAGKTTLGRALAAHFGRPFVDLDAEIAARAGQSIPGIFQQRGEPGFRRLEADVLRAVLAWPTPLVLATGGGTPCFHDGITVLNQHSITLWLDVPVPTLLARLPTPETARRPLLAQASEGLETRLRETLAARIQFYQQARLHCAPSACTVAALLPQLAAAGFPPPAV